MEKVLKTILFLVLVVIVGCSKKTHDEPKYTLEEFNQLAFETTPSNERGEGALNFSDYSPGVNKVESRALVYQRLPFFAIAFETENQARNEARRLNQYYARNWLFDRVEGEPVLEDYVILTFKAQNPNKSIQRVPKKNAAHGESHGDAHAPAHKEEAKVHH